MDDNQMFANTIDTVVEVIILIIMCIPGLLCYTSVARNIALATDANLNHDKIVVTDEINTDDLFDFSGFQYYITCWLINTNSPDNCGIVTAGIDLSKESSDEELLGGLMDKPNDAMIQGAVSSTVTEKIKEDYGKYEEYPEGLLEYIKAVNYEMRLENYDNGGYRWKIVDK